MSALCKAARSLEGGEVWDAQVGIGSFLTLNVGKVKYSSVGMPRGEFRLWVVGAHWRVLSAGAEVANAARDREESRLEVAALDHRTVLKLTFDESMLAFLMSFSGGVDLEVTPLGDPEMEEWLLYLSDGTVVVAGPRGSLTLEDSSASPPLDS